MSEQCHDLHDQLLLMTHAIERRAFGRGKSLAALDALIAMVFSAMNTDVAFTRLPCGRTVQVRAECCMRVHGLPSCCASFG